MGQPALAVREKSFKKCNVHKNLRRYHYKIFFPENVSDMLIDFFDQFDEIRTTNHAAEQLLVDKRTIIPLPTKEQVFHSTNTLVEFYEILDSLNGRTNKIQKVLIRISNLDDIYDFSYVISREGFMISAWATSKSDIHRLTNSMYEYFCPENLKETRYKLITDFATNYVKIDSL